MNVTVEQLKGMTLGEIASVIYADHQSMNKKLYFGAVPYVAALRTLNTIDDHYIMEDGRTIVVYTLCNLSTYKGETARLIKAELKNRLKVKQ